MSLLAVEMSHRCAPVDALERVAASCMDAGKVMQRLLELEHVAEVVLLSTCNRVEVYAVVTAFHDGLFEVTDALADQSAMTRNELTEHLHVHYAGAAVEHLFAVAAGLDSMVVGESQILGQLRTAYAEAKRADTVGRTLHHLTQQALRVGKRVHTEPDIDATGASVLSEALTAAAAALAGPGRTGLADRRVLRTMRRSLTLPSSSGRSSPATPGSAGRRSPAKPRSAERRSPAKPRSAERRSPAKPRSAERRFPATPCSTRQSSPATPGSIRRCSPALPRLQGLTSGGEE